MAFHLEVSHIILEQITDASRWEDGIWHRTVQAMLNQAGYQHKTCVVHAASHGLPQIRPRIFLVACAPGHQLPPAPRPEFHRTLVLPLGPDENGNQVVQERKLRRHKRALRRCYPTAGEDALLYPSQTLEDATSNLEDRENFSLSPVTLVEDLHLPLQHVLAQPPPATTPSADLRFALYLGNAAPAVLAFSRAVLYRFAKDHHAAMERASQRVNSLAGQDKRKAMAAGAGPATAGTSAAGMTTSLLAACGPPPDMVTTSTSARADASQELPKEMEEAFVRVGRAIAGLSTLKPETPVASRQQVATKGQPGKKTPMSTVAAATLRCVLRESYLQVGKRVVSHSVEALERSLEQAPRCLKVLKLELSRVMAVEAITTTAGGGGVASGSGNEGGGNASGNGRGDTGGSGGGAGNIPSRGVGSGNAGGSGSNGG
ncbi:hypothetical protein Vafri_1431, partial [Volvox africanus]